MDALYHDEMVDIVQMTGSPDRAYGVFVDVVKNLFEWDETTHRGYYYISLQRDKQEVGAMCFIRSED